MALPQRYIEKETYSEDEYFAFEADAFGRWEYVRGAIRAMSGGTPDHGAIASNLITALNVTLRGAGNRTCQVFGSDVKVHTGDGVNTFPDVSVFCGPLDFHRRRRDILTNPVLLAEVLSPATAAYERGDKWDSYRTIPSLQHFLLLATDRPRVDLYTRDGAGWHLHVTTGLDASLVLPALGVTLLLADLYDLVDFDGGEALDSAPRP